MVCRGGFRWLLRDGELCNGGFPLLYARFVVVFVVKKSRKQSCNRRYPANVRVI